MYGESVVLKVVGHSSSGRWGGGGVNLCLGGICLSGCIPVCLAVYLLTGELVKLFVLKFVMLCYQKYVSINI